MLDRQDEFDIIHSHLEWSSLLFARGAHVPVAATFHGRLDLPWARELLASPTQAHLVAISNSQASAHPDIDWTVVYNGLTLASEPFEARRSDDLCFVGRVAVEKGIVEAIEIAQMAGRHAADRGQDRALGSRARLLRGRIPARAQGCWILGRVPG